MKGKRAIGLDLLENVQESGIAKEYRLEDLQDMLKVIGDAFSDMIESYLWQVESLLVVNENSRTEPTVKRPEQYTVKNSLMLLEEAKQAMSSDRQKRAMTYYEVAYKGDAVTIKIFELAHKWAPLFGMSEEELKIRMSTAYDNNDLIKADRAYNIFRDIAEQSDNFMIMSDEQAFALADKAVEPYLEQSMLLLEDADSMPTDEN
jgi:hypothetical protein